MTRHARLRQLILGSAAALLLTGGLVSVTGLNQLAQASADAEQLLDPQVIAQARCAGGSAMRPIGSVMAMSGLPRIGRRAEANVPLWPDTGTYAMTVTTSSPEAQAYFNQGLRLSYGFNHFEAIRSFKKAQSLDPNCAMCFWGESIALGPNVNMAMQPPAMAPAWAALKRAQKLMAKATPREQALIAALGKRYQEKPAADRSPLDRAYADAMASVAAAYPGDVDVLTLYAESMMDITPWNYWETGGIVPHEYTKALVPTLEKAIAMSPNHPGALHLYIHAVEATPTPERAEAVADRLYPLMPAAGHMVHMPAHIYMRVGRIKDAIRVNLEAANADEAYFKATEVPAFDVYKIGYYPHNVHFVLVNSYLAGDLDDLQTAAQKLPTLIPEDAARAALLVQPIKSSGLMFLAQMGDTQSVMAAPKPADDLPYLVAMWHYARGLVMTQSGDTKGAEAELAAIEQLSSSGVLFKLDQTIVPAELLGDISMEILRSRIAQAKGDMAGALDHMQQAAELQVDVPYTEPPFWYYPTRQSLGGLLLANGKAKEARDAFQASLLEQPGNAWALYGLMKAYEKLGDRPAAKATQKHFKSAWLGKELNIDLKRM